MPHQLADIKTQEDLQPLITKLKAHNFFGDYLNDKPDGVEENKRAPKRTSVFGTF